MFDFNSFIFGLVLGGILIGLYMTLPAFHDGSFSELDPKDEDGEVR